MTYQPPPPPPGEPPYGQQPPPGGYGAPPPPPPPPPPAAPGYSAPAPGYSAPPPTGGYNQPPAAPYGQPPASSYGAPQYGTPAPGAGFNPSSVNPMDWGIMGLGFLTFIFSFFSYYTVRVSYQGFSQSAHENAWHGFFGWFAAFLALLAGAAVAVELFLPQVKLPAPLRLVAVGLAVVALISVILALVVFPGVSGADLSGLGIHKGRGFGYWIDLIFIIGLVALTVLRLKATGGKLPWEKGTSGPGTTPPPGGGYGPPAGGYGPPQ